MVGLSVVGFVALPLAAQPEPAPPQAALDAAKKRFAEGQRLFDAGDRRGAVEAFKEAYRLTRNPLLLYNIAFVYDKLDDASLALHYYVKFVEDAADNDKNHERLVDATQRVAELRNRLHQEPATAPVAPSTAITTLVHEPVDQSPPGRPVDVTARVPETAGWSVTLYYRSAGEDIYQQVRMARRAGLGDELVGRIPAAAVQGTSVHYYVAARDPDGKVVANSGKASTPNIIYLDPKAPLHAYLEPGDPTAPVLVPVAPPPRPTTAPPSAGPLVYAKWGVAGGALVFLGTSAGLALAARANAETLESEALKSQREECAELPPCRPYSEPRKELERQGQRYELWSNVTLGLGIATAATAGLLWVLDARSERRPRVTPVVTPDGAGAAAVISF